MQKLVLGAVVALACVCLIQVQASTISMNVSTPNSMMSVSHGTGTANSTLTSSPAAGPQGPDGASPTPTSGAVTVKAVAGVLAPIFLFMLL